MNEDVLKALLRKGVESGASDVHLKVGQPPAYRVRGALHYLTGEKLRPEHTRSAAMVLLRDEERRSKIDAMTEADLSYSVEGLGRYRVNIYRQRGTLAVVLRAIPLVIPTLEQLGAPAACAAFAEADRGLVLVVGAAGNGKSSTLAAMIGKMNQTRRIHIVTVEDPIEFLHADQLASISQREVGLDTGKFATALRAALRQDPDVILVGEIRDEETMDIALKGAETGHLVLSTLHTPDVHRTVGRVISLMPASKEEETRERFADALRGIVAQRLLPRTDTAGLALAAEVMVATGTVREAIKRPQGNPPLKELMEKGVYPYGMQTFEMHLRALVKQGIVSPDLIKSAGTF
ncbi:MAG: PilT/PilU family type 4a pilus ATPase [Deltaproteobacteria bacterium]|nr:PilT/PilU family type 4a pilus ATPase [Deltaproteobacteria bacterium]